MNRQLIVVLDFGGQYNQLIARRVRDHGVYCEVMPYTTPIDKIRAANPVGIIFTGGPNSVYLENSPQCDPEIFNLGIPVLGLCYGAQLMAQTLGGEVATADMREFGRTAMDIKADSLVFSGVDKTSTVWMSHTDYIKELPDGFNITATTDSCPVAAMENTERALYAMQYHPEVNHTEFGKQMLLNFLVNVCGCTRDWSMESYAKTAVEELRAKIGDGKVILALSGGVDSSVCAKLLERACGENLFCIFVDNGLMRKNEGDDIEAIFGSTDLNFIRVYAEEIFLSKLAGVSDPEQKRKIIGEEFIRVFEREAQKIGAVDFLAQGTIYPDVIESGAGDAHVIKSHHNVGGLPDVVDFKDIVEPLRLLFKDEVRRLGTELGLPENLVTRQPFPGPGLGIRVVGEVTKEKLDIVREADFIFRSELEADGIAKELGQYFAAITNMRSVGVMGDFRTYDYALALRAVTTTDFMTAEFAKIPYELLDKISTRIINEVRGINRILYDITGKPPSTIEME